jgi:hypothetical protein
VVRQEHRYLTRITKIHFLEKIPDGKRKKLCCVFKFSRPVQENSGDVLTVKLDYVLKGALVDIIPVLIMKNIIDTSSY